MSNLRIGDWVWPEHPYKASDHYVTREILGGLLEYSVRSQIRGAIPTITTMKGRKMCSLEQVYEGIKLNRPETAPYYFKRFSDYVQSLDYKDLLRELENDPDDPAPQNGYQN